MSDLPPPGPSLPDDDRDSPRSAYPMTADLPPIPTAHGAVPTQQDRGLAWTGFGLALVACVPLLPLAGAIVGLVALVRRRAPQWIGTTALVLGLTVTVVQVVVVVAAWGGFWSAMQDGMDRQAEEARESGESAEIRALSVEQGDCLDDPATTGVEGAETVEAYTVTLLPCADKHDLEVIAEIRIAGEDYPGQAAVDRRAERCFAEFRSFVGLPYADSELELYHYFPTERSWRLLGDRTIMCMVGHPARKVSGTLEGSRR